MKRAARHHDNACSFRQKCVRAWKRLARLTVVAIAMCVIMLLIGLVPVNNDFRPSPGGIEVLVVSNSVHAELVLPIDTETINWRKHFAASCFSGDTSSATHVAIGWGDREFFTESPTWADVRLATAARALLWPTAACLHVSLTRGRVEAGESRLIAISGEQYERLVDHIVASFRRDTDGTMLQIGHGGWGPGDAFFLAKGHFHCFNTCNNWVGNALQSAGVRAGWYTPLPRSVFLYLPR